MQNHPHECEQALAARGAPRPRPLLDFQPLNEPAGPGQILARTHQAPHSCVCRYPHATDPTPSPGRCGRIPTPPSMPYPKPYPHIGRNSQHRNRPAAGSGRLRSCLHPTPRLPKTDKEAQDHEAKSDNP